MDKIKECVNKLKNVFDWKKTKISISEIHPLYKLAEDVVALDGMVEKDEVYLDYGNCSNVTPCGWKNKGREQTILALAGKVQGLREIARDLFWSVAKMRCDSLEEGKADDVWIITKREFNAYCYNLTQAIRNHLLKEK